jgi:hypothetical protein
MRGACAVVPDQAILVASLRAVGRGQPGDVGPRLQLAEQEQLPFGDAAGTGRDDETVAPSGRRGAAFLPAEPSLARYLGTLGEGDLCFACGAEGMRRPSHRTGVLRCPDCGAEVEDLRAA